MIGLIPAGYRLESRKPRQRLAAKLVVYGSLLLLLALLSIGLTMWVTRQLDGGAAAVNEAGRLRMLTWRLVGQLVQQPAPALITARLTEIDATLALLQTGDPERPLFVPWNEVSRSRFAALQASWQELRPRWRAQSVGELSALTPQVEQFVARVDALVGAIETTLSRLTAILNLFQFFMMALAALAAVAMFYVAHLFILFPLRQMLLGLRQVEEGDFSVRVVDDSSVEFGSLAEGFNRMTVRLQSLYQGLEDTVKEKTRDLESERSRLAALYEISHFLAQAPNLEALAQGFAQKLRRISGADAVAVRWRDEASQCYLLLANDCLPIELAAGEYSIAAGACACGQRPTEAQTRTIPIANECQGQRTVCSRNGYRALVSVPVRLQQNILGEVDLFYRTPPLLEEQDTALFDALANHMANAAENLRFAALQREAAAGEERSLLARELHDSIAQSLSFLRIQLTLLRQALAEQHAENITSTVEEIDVGLKECTHDVRELLLHFRTRTRSDDIEAALRTTLQIFSHQSGIKAELEMLGQGIDLPSDVQLQVLHVIQEALSNVRKHSGASRVQLLVNREPKWRFTVRDNGRGFAVNDHQSDDAKVGLYIMQERAQRIGAQFSIQSTPGVGSEVSLGLSI